ncbi:MAG: VOC family protein [Geodermatophilaceae bacterium]
MDCPDPGALATFYGAMLDWKVDASSDCAEVRAELRSIASGPNAIQSLVRNSRWNVHFWYGDHEHQRSA